MRGMIPLKDKRKLYEAPKPHFYYHTEYNLFPNDSEPVKTDIVTYGVAAKIYSETDSKVLKTWQDGDKTWITWTHRFVLGIMITYWSFILYNNNNYYWFMFSMTKARVILGYGLMRLFHFSSA